MKKIVLILLVLTVVTSTMRAQKTSDTFANKDNFIGVGFGLGGVYGLSKYDTQSPVFGAQYDRGIYEFKFGGVLGVGGFLGYKSYANRYDPNNGNEKYKQRWNIVIIGARGTFHYDVFKVKNLDTYGGAMVAFHVVNYTDNLPQYVNYEDDHASAAYASIYAGAKYYFTPQFAAFAELGYGVSWLTMGVGYKF